MAIEIATHSSRLPDYSIPSRTAIVVSNEGQGLSPDFLDRCEAVISIPQFGEAECLNVGVSYAIAAYELNRDRLDILSISGTKSSIKKKTG